MRPNTQKEFAQPKSALAPNFSLVVFSHLRWNFVFQRPQHILSRLAKRFPVIFIEEPMRGERPGWEITRTQENVTVCCPRTPIDSPGFSEEQMLHLKPLVRELAAELRSLDVHSDGVAAFGAVTATGDRVRLHGRTFQILERPVGAAAA